MSDNIQGQGYLGAQDQGSDGSDFNSTTFVVQQELSRINTATPVRIVKPPYDKDGKTIEPGSVVPVGYVDVVPLVNQIDGRGQPTKHATVHRISYHRFQGGGNAIIADPEKDDIGTMVVADRDTSSVRATNDQANPGSRRRFDKADGIYHGSTQQKEKPSQYVTFTKDGMIWRDRNNNTITTNKDGVTIADDNKNTIVMNKDGIFLNGAQVTHDGDVISKPRKISLEKHTHNGVMTGAGHTNQPDPG